MEEKKIQRHFGSVDGASMVRTSLLRMYTTLEEFDVTTAGLYAYFRSWRNTNGDAEKKNTVWLQKEYMFEQTGLGRTAFNKRLEVLKRYGLITELDSNRGPNKKIYYVHDPLSRDAFLKKYPDELKKFIEEVEKIEKKSNENNETLARIAELNRKSS
jgi:predicted transcriptional regulator